MNVIVENIVDYIVMIVIKGEKIMNNLKINSFEKWIEANTKLYWDEKEETFKNNDNKNQKE